MGNDPVLNSPWEIPMVPYAHNIHPILSCQPPLGTVPLLTSHTEISVKVSL